MLGLFGSKIIRPSQSAVGVFSTSTLKMVASSPSAPLTAAAFFSEHYNKLSGWLNRFAHLQHQARKVADPSAIVALASLSEQILGEALVITQAAPGVAPSAGTHGSFFPTAWQLHDYFSTAPQEPLPAVAAQLQSHLAYAQERLPQPFAPSAPLAQDERSIFCDCVLNCVRVVSEQVFNAYQWSCPDPRLTTEFFDTSAVSSTLTPWAASILERVKVLEGWCSPQKSLLLYSLIRQYKPKTAVEIGIYGGRSIVPIAAALKDNGIGSVYGVETWSGSAATTYRTSIANDFWWMNIDFSLIKGNFLKFIVDHDLHDTIKIVEASSDQCAPLFGQIDFLHIDGGHSTFGAAKDVVDYVSKVPSGGIIVYDDINWPSTAAGLDILRDSCQLLQVVTAFGSDTEPGCAAFIKI